jgi:hypothetical protein
MVQNFFRKACMPIAIAVLSLTLISSANASEGTLTLDALSFVSFGDNVKIPIPSGSTIKFVFGDPAPDGTISFTIQPEGVLIPPLDLPSGQGRLEYSLGSAASGSISPSSTGRVISFVGDIQAAFVGDESDSPPFSYSTPFTTETVAASDILGELSVEKSGLRMVENVWYVQLVGATTNKANAFPEPGAWVYTVLSGQFDQLPSDP